MLNNLSGVSFLAGEDPAFNIDFDDIADFPSLASPPRGTVPPYVSIFIQCSQQLPVSPLSKAPAPSAATMAKRGIAAKNTWKLQQRLES